MHDIYIVHSSRTYMNDTDKQHISWYTMSLLGKALELESNCKQQITVCDNLEIIKLEEPYTIVMFLIGEPTETVKQLANNARKLVIVAEDPNWECNMMWCKRDWQLVTWSAAIAGLDCDNAINYIQEHVPHWHFNKMVSNTPMSLIEIIINYDRDLPNNISIINNIEDILHDEQHSPACEKDQRFVYVGSLKADRADQLKMLAEYGCVFYGNFTINDLQQVTKCMLPPGHVTECKGRIRFIDVIAKQREHVKIAYCPDQAIMKLQLDTLRKLELLCSMTADTELVTLDKRAINELTEIANIKNTVDKLDLNDELNRYLAGVEQLIHPKLKNKAVVVCDQIIK